MKVVVVPRVVAACAAAPGAVPTTRRVAGTGLALLAALAAGGCSGAPREAPDAVEPASAYIDVVLGTAEELAEQQATRFEEVVAACMAESGFEYVLNLSSLGFTDYRELEHPPGTREFAEQYGYGLASQPAEMVTTSEFGDNPNDVLIQAMSESEAAEFEAAYIGDLGELESGEEPDWEHSGCQGRATHEVFRSGAVADATYLALKEEVDRIEAQVVPADPDVVAADAAWSACMADAGSPGYASQPDAAEQWLEHFQASGGGGGGVGPDGMTPGQAELIQEETALATADWDCADAVAYQDVVSGVRNAAQQEYVNAHRDELDAWVQKWTEDAA